MNKPSSIEVVLEESIYQIRKKGSENGCDEVYIDSIIHDFNETIKELIKKKADEKIVKFTKKDNV